MNASITVLDAMKCLKNGNFDKDDIKHFLRWGAIGFVALGTYKLSTQVVTKNISASAELKDMTESIHLDPKLCQAFIQLQAYRKLNPWLFRTSLQNADHLLFLESVLLDGDVIPVKNDKIIAYTHFKMSVTRLTKFNDEIFAALGSAHGLAVNMHTKIISSQLQKHLMNILHVCSQFKPHQLIEQALNELQRLQDSSKDYKLPTKTSQ